MWEHDLLSRSHYRMMIREKKQPIRFQRHMLCVDKLQQMGDFLKGNINQMLFINLTQCSSGVSLRSFSASRPRCQWNGLGVVLSIHHVDRLNVDASTGPGGQDVSVRNKHRETPGQGENDGHTSFSKKRSFQGEYFQHKLKINEALRFCVCVSFIRGGT